MLMVAAICFRLCKVAHFSQPFPLPSALLAAMSTMRCTPSCFGAFTAAFARCKRSFRLRGFPLGCGCFGGSCGVLCVWVSVSSTAARSKSSPSFRAVIGFVLSGVRQLNLPRLSLTVIPCCNSFPEKSSKETAAQRLGIVRQLHSRRF